MKRLLCAVSLVVLFFSLIWVEAWLFSKAYTLSDSFGGAHWIINAEYLTYCALLFLSGIGSFGCIMAFPIWIFDNHCWRK